MSMNRTIFVFVSVVASGCNFGKALLDSGHHECKRHVSAQVQIDASLRSSSSTYAVFVKQYPNQESDNERIDGVDEQRIPYGPALGNPSLTRVIQIGQADGPQPMTAAIEQGVAIKKWIFAYVDENGNGSLDRGEPFGVDPNNPSEKGCEDYTSLIAIADRY